MPATSNHTSVEKLNQANVGKLPGHIGLEITEVADGKVVGRFKVRDELVAHTGFLLAGAVLSVADILCAYGVSTAWPEGSSGFTTAEVKCNFVGTLREGEAVCTATLLHGGRTTQVWDARVEDAATGKLMAAFRCTQVILYPRG
jgi:1,4-dihydroxy-2-naphthoyl-CoA hydrolase